MKQKTQFYSLNRILSKNAKYNIIFGERSNGKTYAVQSYALENYFNNGGQCAVVRRWREDFKGKNGREYFKPLVENGVLRKLSNGEYTDITYYSGAWFLCKYDDEQEKNVRTDNAIAYSYALTSTEHDKGGGSGVNITTVLFDEMLSREGYLPDEFILFANTLSTIVRMRDNVTVFMLGNTVNKYCPYFAEMGLKHISQMKKGDIDVYTYGDSGLIVAVEYSDGVKIDGRKGKPSDVYFAFDNPKLNMITGGSWELALYPHCPCKYKPADVVFIYFIQFDENLLQAEIVQTKTGLFTYIHRKTTPLKDLSNNLLYTTDYNVDFNKRRKITKPVLPIEKKILKFFVEDKVFYQDNEVGEVVRNYLKWAQTEKVT